MHHSCTTTSFVHNPYIAVTSGTPTTSEFKDHFDTQVVVFSFKACCHDPTLLPHLHAYLLKTNLFFHIYVASALLRSYNYSPASSPDSAHNLFDEMPPLKPRHQEHHALLPRSLRRPLLLRRLLQCYPTQRISPFRPPSSAPTWTGADMITSCSSLATAPANSH
ncbi:hypothetical protein ZIOFF_068481 [Zingiber officinale]|uniref:Uncharacterized protein n=1 Tax=Zingiber officinale TaxID=94328 RepID=A0A8J5EV14_ZINOF|nr:hypothetical protein ZIOFF_068481 [Zingiber officinale]